MNFPYLDAHTHAQFPAYDNDRDAVLARAREAGVRMVNVGTTAKTSEAAVALARAYPELCFATVGVHPSHAMPSSYHDTQELGEPFNNSRELLNGEVFDPVFFQKLAADPSVVAIGECGLDFSRVGDEATREKQRALFLAHMKFAKEAGKPLMIHCRAAFPDLLRILTTHYQLLATDDPGIIHFFGGTLEEANDLLALGFSFTFGGVITFARDYDGIVRAVPMDRILSETDAPYVTPAPYRGKRNEPAYVVEVVKKLADLKDTAVGELAAQMRANASRIFHIA